MVSCVRRNSKGNQDTAEAEAAQRFAGHGPADALDDDIDALARHYPAHAFGEAFCGQVDHVIEAKLARVSGLRSTSGGRNHLGRALRAGELIGRRCRPIRRSREPAPSCPV